MSLNNDTVPYGSYPYGQDGYKGGEVLSDYLHYYALVKTWPVPEMLTAPGDNYLNDLFVVEGEELDNVQYSNEALEPEVFPDTSVQLLNQFELMFDTTSTGTIAERQQNVIVKEMDLVNKEGKLNPSHYIAVAAQYGVTDTTVVEGIHQSFVVSNDPTQATPLPAPVYDAGQPYRWWMDSTVPVSFIGSDEQANFEASIIKDAPAWSYVQFNYTGV